MLSGGEIEMVELATEISPEQIIVVNLSGRGDKDIHTVAQLSGVQI